MVAEKKTANKNLNIFRWHRNNQIGRRVHLIIIIAIALGHLTYSQCIQLIWTTSRMTTQQSILRKQLPMWVTHTVLDRFFLYSLFVSSARLQIIISNGF
jgi:hypothetical protein